MAKAMSIQDVEQAARQFGLPVREVRPLSSMYRDAACFLVETTENERVVIKPWRGKRQDMENLFAKLQWLRSMGYQHIPAVRLDANGRPYTCVGARCLYAMEHIEGHTVSLTAEYEELGRALYRLHHLGRRQVTSQIPDVYRKVKRRYVAFQGDLRELCTKQEAMWFRVHGAECENLCQSALKILRDDEENSRSASRDMTWVHHDVTRPNIRIRQGTLILIDWDGMKCSSALQELARAASNVCDFDWGKIYYLLRGYEYERRLTKDERRVFAAYFMLPREAWHSAKLAKSHAPYDLSILATTWLKRLQAVQVVAEWAGEEVHFT